MTPFPSQEMRSTIVQPGGNWLSQCQKIPSFLHQHICLFYHWNQVYIYCLSNSLLAPLSLPPFVASILLSILASSILASYILASSILDPIFQLPPSTLVHIIVDTLVLNICLFQNSTATFLSTFLSGASTLRLPAPTLTTCVKTQSSFIFSVQLRASCLFSTWDRVTKHYNHNRKKRTFV